MGNNINRGCDRAYPREANITRIFLIRHGEVSGSQPKRYNGHRDVDLSPKGQSQMEEMAVRLTPHPIVAIYCSDLMRTFKGAEILSRENGLPVYKSPALREKSFGAWEGLTYEEASARFPEDWKNWIADPAGSRPPGGETFREVEHRVLDELPRIINTHRGQEVVILAHGGTNRVILCHALNLDLSQVFRIEQSYAALNIIDFSENGSAKVLLMNG